MAGIVGSICAILPLVIWKPALFFYFILLAIDDGLYQRLGLRLRPELYSHFLQPTIYWSSIRKLQKMWLFPLFFLLGNAVFLYLIHPADNRLINLCLLSLVFVPSPKDHLLLLPWKNRIKTPVSRPYFSFPTENAVFLSPDYPLLRITRSFQGKKRFDISLGEKKPHVIFYFLESFRSKNVGCLKSVEGVTPCFDALSKKGVLFSQFYANGNSTSWATIASLFGIPSAMVPSYQHYYVGLPLIGLPQIMKGEGYHPAVIQGSHLLLQGTDAFYHTHGFETIIGKREIEEAHFGLPSTSWGIHDEGLVRYSIDWLKKQKDPVFLNLFSITNHHPWICPPTWERQHFNPFLDTMSYTDWALGEFVRLLEQENLLDNTILFILGDHGQSIGEHDRQIEVHRMLYEEDVRVPLLILAPQISPCVIDTPCSQIDLLPTVLDIFGCQSPHHSLGTSLLRDKKRFVYCSYPLEEGTIASRLGKWKCILKGSQEELFDISHDPAEHHNLVEKQPFRLRRLKKMLQNYSNRLENLYEGRAFAPPLSTNGSLHYAPPKDITDDQLFQEMLLRRPLISLDLSNTQIQGKNLEDPTLRHLNLSKCLWVKDQLVADIARSFPKIVSLNLSHCPLLSDSGIHALLSSSSLEELNLEGIDDLCRMPDHLAAALHLRKLSLLHCPKLDGATWAPWIASLPQLNELKLTCTSWSDADLSHLYRLHMLGFLFLEGGEHLSMAAIQGLIEANHSLIELSLERCPNVGDELLHSLQKRRINYLTITDNSLITDGGLQALSKMPLQWLIFQNCPGITAQGLAQQVRDGLTIFVTRSPQLSATDIELMRSHGIHVWP